MDGTSPGITVSAIVSHNEIEKLTPNILYENQKSLFRICHCYIVSCVDMSVCEDNVFVFRICHNDIVSCVVMSVCEDIVFVLNRSC